VKIDDNALIDLFNRASVMVYAPRLEPFGYSPLEANACGLPVVAVAEGGVRETIIDGVNGLLVEYDPRAMALVIARLLQEPSTARRLGATGRKLVVEKWSLEAAMERLEQHLIKVAHGAYPPSKHLVLDKADYWKAWLA
jgi:glycosyltransferase involved in cell wall biosynthesis